MSYDKHLEKNLERDERNNAHITYKRNGEIFSYEYDFGYDELTNRYLSYAEEVTFCRATKNKKRLKKLTKKIDIMRKEYPEIFLKSYK